MAIERMVNFHTLHLQSRILSEVIKELDIKELCVTKLVISANKTIETKSEKLPIPELEQFTSRPYIDKQSRKWDEIRNFPLWKREQTQEMLNQKTLEHKDGINLEYVNKVLTNPPYEFPYVRVEELQGTILKEVPKGTPKKITFKRTLVKQAAVVSTLKPQPHAGPKYTLELTTTRRKEPVERIRELIAQHDPIKFCEQILKEDYVTICKEILKPKD